MANRCCVGQQRSGILRSHCARWRHPYLSPQLLYLPQAQPSLLGKEPGPKCQEGPSKTGSLRGKGGGQGSVGSVTGPEAEATSRPWVLRLPSALGSSHAPAVTEATAKDSSAPWATAIRSQAEVPVPTSPTLPHTRQGCPWASGAGATIGLPCFGRAEIYHRLAGKHPSCQLILAQASWGRRHNLPHVQLRKLTPRNRTTCLRSRRWGWDFHVAPRP